MAERPLKNDRAGASEPAPDDESLPDYETALAELQHLIDQVEAGEVSLEKSLEHYARGMKLYKHCRAILDRAEQHFEQLTSPTDTSEE